MFVMPVGPGMSRKRTIHILIRSGNIGTGVLLFGRISKRGGSSADDVRDRWIMRSTEDPFESTRGDIHESGD